MDLLVTIQEVCGCRRMRRFGVVMPMHDDVHDPMDMLEEELSQAVRGAGFSTVPVDPQADYASGAECDDLIAELIGGDPDAARAEAHAR